MQSFRLETTLQSYPVSTAEREEIKFEDQLGASIAIYHELTSFGVKTIEFYRTVKEKKTTSMCILALLLQ